MKRILKSVVMFAGLLSLEACGFIPTTGPTMGEIQDQAKAERNVSFVVVTPALAEQFAAVDAEDTKAADERNMQALQLQSATSSTPVLLMPGDVVNLTLWTTPMATMSDSSTAPQVTLNQTALGNYTVDEVGDLVLPYAGSVNVEDQSIATAERRIASRFANLGQFNQAQVSMNMQTNNRQYVIVTGSANNPAIINWQTGGLTLSEAITEAGSYKIFSDSVQGHDLKTNLITIERADHQYQIAMQLALESDIPLMPGDLIVLGHKDDTRIHCLGGGWNNDTTQAYEYTPTLAEVVADGGGLSMNAAKGEAVYILSNDYKTIYEIRWDTLDGLIASQSFPVPNGDVVYIATSPSVKFQQITSILFSAAYPVATANTL